MLDRHLPYSAARRRVVQGVSFALLVIWGLTALYVWQDRRETIARGEERALAFVALTDAFVQSRLREVDAGLRELLSHAGDEAGLRLSIDVQRRVLPYLDGLGMIVPAQSAGESDPALRGPVSRWALDTAAAPSVLVVGDPIDRPGKVPVLPLMMAAADGRRAIALIPSDFLEGMHRLLNLDDSYLSALVSDRGVVLSRAPYVREGVGRRITASDAFANVSAQQRGAVAEFVSPVNRRDYLLGMRRLPVGGLSVRAGQPWNDVLEAWGTRTWRGLALSVLLSVATAFLAWNFLKRVTKEAAEREAYAQRDAEHRLALESLSEGVVSQMPDGKVRAFNPAALRILGMTESQLLDRSSLDPSWRARRDDGSDIPGEEHPVMLAMRTGKPQRGVSMEVSDGRGQRRWLEVNASPTFEGDLVSGAVASFADVTERRIAQQRIEELNRTLEQRVAQRTEQLRRLTADLATAEERERREIARDLHDDIAQTLAAARIHLAPLLGVAQEEVRAAARKVADMVERADTSVRSLAAQLAPPALDTLGLASAIEWLAEEFHTLYGMAITVENGAGKDSLSAAARMIVYRAVRELLVNVGKHAGVDRARVALSRQDHQLAIHVFDAGVGFAVTEASAGVGLRELPESLARVGGVLRIESGPGGTQATITVPDPAGREDARE